MKKKIKISKKGMSAIRDIINQIKKKEKPQSFILSINNTDNHSTFIVGCNTFEEVAYIHWGIILGLDEYVDVDVITKQQEYAMALYSQEIESIIRQYDEWLSDPNYIKTSSFINVFQPVLDHLKMLVMV